MTGYSPSGGFGDVERMVRLSDKRSRPHNEWLGRLFVIPAAIDWTYPMSNTFNLTAAERDFLHHFNHESVTATPGPATLWLRQCEIFPTVMQTFQYAEQRSNPRYIDRITEDTLPPFRPAWSSREEFHARASEIVAVFPELKTLGSALPDFHPHFTSAQEKILS